LNEPVLPTLDTVYEVSANGWQQLQRSSTVLPPGTLGFLMLLNGELSLAHVAKQLKDMPEPALRALAMGLEQKGYIRPVKITDSARARASDAIDFLPDWPLEPSQDLAESDPDDARNIEVEAEGFAVMLTKQGYAVRIAPRAARTVQPVSGKVYSALFVDDTPGLAGIVGRFLELEGFVPRHAANRDEIAAELRRAPPPDVILLDVGLPDVDGFTVLRRVRQDTALMHIPVIMVTGNTSRQDIMRALSGGADGYITKPFEFNALLNSIGEVLGLQPPARE
jgi:two-component system, OmpR family, response regulator